MKYSRATLVGALLVGALCLAAQPDYQRHANAVQPVPADPAIARALQTIHASSIQQTIEALVGFGTRNTLTSMDTDLPPGQGINAAADWIAGQFEEVSHQCGGCLEVHRDVFIADPASGDRWARRIPRPTKLTNIYAILHGTDPIQSKRMLLVTGHYDSINSNVFKNWADTSGAAPGANDDASGVAVSLACARALSKLRFPATIVFVTVAGEEQGLVGSAHLAKLAHEQGWQLEAVLNNDIVGGNTTPGDMLQQKDRIRVFSEGVPATASEAEMQRILALGKDNDSPSREVARAVAAVARTYMPGGFTASLIDRPDRYLRGGDHSSFNHEGFAAVRLTEWREDYNHQHQNIVIPPAGSREPIKGDLPRFVDYNYVERVAKLNAATLATLAAAPEAPQHVTLDTEKLDDNTTLRWQSSPGATEYEVVWRETTAPDWQYVQSVAAESAQGELNVTLPISKDNVMFGVRGVDAKGHRSLVVVP